MGAGTTCLKYLTFFFNFIFFIAGLAIIIAGSVAKIQLSKTDNSNIESAQIHSISTILIAIIVIGVIVTLISFFGCCGSIKEDICMLNTYGAILLILFLIELALGIFIFVIVKKEGPELHKEFKLLFENLWENYNKEENAKEIVDTLQTTFECCGVDSYAYWNENIPESCCKEDICTKTNAYRVGCLKAVSTQLISYVKKVGVAALVIAIIEILGSIIGICLGRQIANNRKYYT